MALAGDRGAAELDELHDFHLIDHLGDDRYRMHDLLQLLARELLDAHDSVEEQRAAIIRMLDYNLFTGHAAAMTLDPHRSPVLENEQPGSAITTYQDAFEWFTAEHRSMLAMVRVAAEQGLDDHAWKLTWTFATYLDRHGHSREHIDALNVGLAAADRLGDLRVQALLNRLLGHALTRLGRYAEGHRHHAQALRVFCDAGDRVGEAHTCNALSRVCEKLGSFDDALTYAQRAHDLYEQLENRVRQARVLNQVVALDNLGYIHHQLGVHETAVTCYRRAIATYRSTSDDHSAANTLSRLGDAYVTVQDLAAAGRAWREALRVLRALEHPDAEVVEEKLRSAIRET